MPSTLALAAAGFFVYASFFTELPVETHITYDSIYSAKKNAFSFAEKISIGNGITSSKV